MFRVVVHFTWLNLQLLGLALAAPVWQLGADDAGLLPFSQESFGPNNAPGSANLKDDDYYLAGTYPSPVGVVAADENIAFMERAVTSSDPRVRVHFPLTAAQAASMALAPSMGLDEWASWPRTRVT